jgi:hypothetical protein
MLPNRVDPYGNILQTAARGYWMGNRGQLHGEGKTILRPYKLKAWITCLLEFKGRNRQVMSPRLYTELFFWDEATAFAAGHRPCCECRRADYNRFKQHWLSGNKLYNFNAKVSVGRIDEILHAERIDKQGKKITYKGDMKTLPDGTFIEVNGKPFLLLNELIYPWSFSGYGEKERFPQSTQVTVLTPPSIVNAFRAGYVPEIRLQQ